MDSSVEVGWGGVEEGGRELPVPLLKAGSWGLGQGSDNSLVAGEGPSLRECPCFLGFWHWRAGQRWSKCGRQTLGPEAKVPSLS